MEPVCEAGLCPTWPCKEVDPPLWHLSSQVMKTTLFYSPMKTNNFWHFHAILHTIYTKMRKLIWNLNMPNQLELIMHIRQASFSITFHLNCQPAMFLLSLRRGLCPAQHPFTANPRDVNKEEILCFELLLLKCFRAKGTTNLGLRSEGRLKIAELGISSKW